MKQTYTLSHAEARRRACAAVMAAPDGYVVAVGEPKRNLEQNALLWALLSEVSESVIWHGRKLSPDAWKNIFTAAWKKQDVVPGIDGGFVVLGVSTSSLSKREFSELIELISAFMAEQRGRIAA